MRRTEVQHAVDRVSREAMESRSLASYGARSAQTRRRYHEHPDPYRTEFQRDRDRILHSTGFRRLQHKTQVFVVTEGDFYRTRLTHTLEVSQIARSIAAALGLNVDLVEAVALAHDLGHPPFGHAGEQELHALMADHGGFEHNIQSLRVVDLLEVRYAMHPGLNLSWHTRQGIAMHATIYDMPVPPEEFASAHASLESQVVDLADMIAYSTHDLDDALRIGLAEEADLVARDIELWTEAARWADGLVARRDAADTQVELSLEEVRGEVPRHFLPPGSRQRDEVRVREAIRWMIGRLVEDVIQASAEAIRAAGVESPEAVMRHPQRLIRQSALRGEQLRQLAFYLRDVVYYHPEKLLMERKARRIVRALFETYANEPRLLPRVTQERLAGAGVHRVVCDYISGMTDRSALDLYSRLFETHEIGFGGSPST